MRYVTSEAAPDGRYKVLVGGRPITETREEVQARTLVHAIRRLRSLQKAKESPEIA
jgi:hypothetical protein